MLFNRIILSCLLYFRLKYAPDDTKMEQTLLDAYEPFGKINDETMETLSQKSIAKFQTLISLGVNRAQQRDGAQNQANLPAPSKNPTPEEPPKGKAEDKKDEPKKKTGSKKSKKSKKSIAKPPAAGHDGK